MFFSARGIIFLQSMSKCPKSYGRPCTLGFKIIGGKNTGLLNWSCILLWDNFIIYFFKHYGLIVDELELCTRYGLRNSLYHKIYSLSLTVFVD